MKSPSPHRGEGQGEGRKLATTAKSRRAVLLATLMTTILTACGLTPPAPAPPALGDVIWPAPGNPLELTVLAGLRAEPKETLIFHVHAHLDVFIDGSPVRVPAGIGINVMDPAVKHGTWNGDPTYGGIAGCSEPCISPLHTHASSGVIHTESTTSTPNRLGQFFTEWGVTLSGACVGQYCEPTTAISVYVDGKRYSGNVADIPLTDRKEIAIVIGSAPKQIPSSFPPWATL
jgi:hypothetical protein